MSVKLTIFLDIDGVLTPIRGEGQVRDWLACLDVFESAVRPFLSQIEIVLSSSWRHAIDLEDFRSALSPDVAAVVIGATGPAGHRKLDEIRAWLEVHGQRAWLAIDDDESEFESERQLIVIDPRVGFSQESAEELQDRLRELGYETQS